MRIILTIALLTLGLSAYTFENKPRVDDINSSIQELVNDVAFNSSTSKLTVTKVGGGSFDVDLSFLASGGGSSNAIKTITLNSAGKKLVLTKVDGSTSNVNVSALYDSVNVASGTLDTGSKSIKLTLNDASNTVVSIDMSSIYNHIESVKDRTVDTLQYSGNNIKLRLNDGTEIVATIPNATQFSNGLLSAGDKSRLNNLFSRFFGPTGP